MHIVDIIFLDISAFEFWAADFERYTFVVFECCVLSFVFAKLFYQKVWIRPGIILVAVVSKTTKCSGSHINLCFLLDPS